jgi:hypothetical protein
MPPAFCWVVADRNICPPNEVFLRTFFPGRSRRGGKKAGAKNSLCSCFGPMLIFAKLPGQLNDRE